MSLEVITPPEAYFEFLIIPVAILIAGISLFHFKHKHRRVIGASLVLLSIIELSYYSIRYPNMGMSLIQIAPTITLLVGIISIFYSTKYANHLNSNQPLKNNFGALCIHFVLVKKL
jgi:CHASE2 domain-containing sensor protein